MISANDALEKQQQLYENEQKRFNAGLITIDDIFTQDDKYLNSQTQYYQLMITYLQSVLLFKYYTGNLVGITESDKDAVQKKALYNVSGF